MNFKTLKLFLITLIIFLSLDMVWLQMLAKNLHLEQIGFLMSDNPNLVSAVIFYLIYVAALIHFVIFPSLSKNSPKSALLNGAIFGLVSYATYDLTNLAVIKHWPLTITVIDLAWGSVVTAATCVLSTKLYLKLLK